MGQRSLTEIANSHGTDKGTVGPSRLWRAHNYTDVYDAYLSPLRDRPVDVLEIGLGVTGAAWRAGIARGRNGTGGASMRTWSEYFPAAHVYGLDINPAGFLDTDRVHTYVVDQGDPAALDRFLATVGDTLFDVVVDDGSHRPDHQQITLGRLFPRVRPGGLYFIEDLLSNGLGDGRHGRSAADAVLNTRRLLKAFQSTGTFPAPHALGDTAYLEEHVDRVSFHVPQVHPGLTRGRLRSLRPLRFAPRYAADEESLCVLQKR